MKSNRINIISLSFALFFLTSSVSISQKKVPLKGLYATSTAIPHKEHNASNLFDNDLTTYWSTMTGAGPGEGIMVYFFEPQDVSYLKVSMANDENIIPTERITYYVNGANPKTVSLDYGSLIQISSTNVLSLYLKLDNLARTKKKYFDGVKVLTFEDVSLGFSKIEFFNSEKEKLELIPPTILKAKVTASSTLEPKLSYGVQNLFDGRNDFGWVEGVDGNGINESITIDLNQTQTITGIKIANGFQRSAKHFSGNARVKKMTVSNENGNSVEIFIKDNMNEQSIPFSTPLKGKTLKFVITQAYHGTKYEDLVISELKLISNKQEISINPQMMEKIKKDALAKIKGTVLENKVDRQIYNSMEEIDGYTRSIILRSDHTFVAYSNTWDSNDNSNEIVAEGNWQIKDLTTNGARVRVFGKLTQISKIVDYYNGDSKSSYLQIFQDYLNISDKKISGEKFIEDFIISNE